MIVVFWVIQKLFMEQTLKTSFGAPEFGTPAPLVWNKAGTLHQPNPEAKWIDLSAIHIEEKKQLESSSSIDFSDKTQDQKPKDYTLSYWKTIIISSFLLSFFVLFSVLFGFFTWYFQTASQPQIDPNSLGTIETVKYTDSRLTQYIPFNDFHLYDEFAGVSQGAFKTLQWVLAATNIHFIHKRDVIQHLVNTVSQSIMQEIQAVDRLRRQISTYGFYPQTFEFLLWQASSQSIQQSIVSIEAIKFSTALKVFSYLDTFLNQFSLVTGLPVSVIKSNFSQIVERWEGDVFEYLMTCYINPFEDQNCSLLNDFARNYQLNDTTAGIDTSFFTALITFIDQKLENADFPSLSIAFQNFDPTAGKITLTIQINTFQQDEIDLLSRWIVNPHIFIVSNLISLLKESRIIIGEGININQLKVNKRTIKVWSTEVVVNNSSLQVSVPLQKSTQREIFDFAPGQ